ncbi:MAG: hypothetical protein Q8K58_02750 [Acidimicrobiales bacterium]|nr:hypothetical protein [Acidimicrobiales bacterium]
MRRRLALAALLVGAASACSSDQDPGVPTQSTGAGQTTTTSRTLPSCPSGGPDESTPAGCLDEDGTFLRP